MPGGGSANNPGQNNQGVPGHYHGQAGVPASSDIWSPADGVQGQGVHVPAQQPGHGAANHGIPEQQVWSVWGDLNETQEDRVMNQYTVNNMNSFKVEEEKIVGYNITNFLGKKPGKQAGQLYSLLSTLQTYSVISRK